MDKFITLISMAILLQVRGEIPGSISCISTRCHAVLEISSNFQTALDKCKENKGSLMTVQSYVSNDVIRDLLADVKGEFWIGLRFNDKGCTDTSSALRGYEWVTGDPFTEYTNWRGDETFCTPMCVSVSRDLKWTERPCRDNIDGFLCEKDYSYVCEPLEPEKSDVSLHYVTPLGNEGESVIPLSLPEGSIVTVKPSGIRHICAPDFGWMRAPWSCEVWKGGCEYNCVQNTGKPLCDCPLGQALQSNGVSCEVTLNDPCLNLGCEHICLPSERSCFCRDGYELQEDGKACRDVDECVDKVICPNSRCINTEGSYECSCPSGFRKHKNGLCVDINECSMSPCEHECSNTEGSFTCSCFKGYIQKTEDHTKCKLHCDQRECPAECDINIPTQCECPEGFVRDDAKHGIMCIDIDECESNYCAHNCTNTYGGHICSCPAGFQLVGDGDCVEYPKEGSGFTTPALETVTPTSNITKAVTPGALLGIMVFIVLMILIIVFLTHQISKRRSSWEVACLQKSKGEDLRELQQVTTQKYTKKSSFVNRDLKEVT